MNKKKRKRILSTMLTVCVLASSVSPVNVFAKGTEGVDKPYKPYEEPESAYPAAGMKATVGTQQAGNYGGNRVLDSNPETLWEGKWNKVKVEDAWIVLDLGGAKTVSGIAQLPRGNKFAGGDLNGVITGYDVQVSTDGGETYESKAVGTWSERKEWKYAAFEPVEGVTHVKLQATALSTQPQNPNNVTIAEFRVLDDTLENGDTSALDVLIAQVGEMDKNNYTEITWNVLEKEVQEASELLKKEWHLQSEIDLAAERVQDAIDALQEVGNENQVMEKLNEAKQISNEEHRYYDNTYYELQKIIKETEYKLEGGLTKEESDKCIAEIQRGLDGLIVRDASHQSAFDTTAARDSIKRLIGKENEDKLSQIELRAIDKKECDYDYYEYYEEDGKLVIAATTNASILTGFNHWLKYVANCNISWKEDQVNLPQQLPMPEEPVYQSANAQRRFAGNDMTEQYDGNFWNWEEWEREIDLLALNGFNEVLVYVGQESVFYKTFEELGVENMLDEMPRVSFVPSLFLGGSWRFKADDANNSPNILTSMTPDIMEKRLEIGQKVCARLRELGMEPIMPGCSGYLAYGEIDGIPKEDIVKQGAWASMPRPGWLKSTSEFYPQLASTYYRIQEELFGECKNWKIDLFNEGGTMGGVDAADVGKIIQDEMLKVHPDATWHIMHWTGPNPDILKGTDTSKVFIHDIKTTSEFDREERWNKAEYGFSHLNSMGSRTTMGARVKDLSAEYWKRMSKPGTKLDGVGVAPEGGHHEPIVLESLGELAWQNAPTDGEQWFVDYADRRYGLVEGQPDEHARKAWKILGDTVYNQKGNNPTGDILFAMAPSHSGTMASPTGPASLGFDAAKMREALSELLQVNPKLRETKTYQYDLILVTTQVFTAYSRETLPKIKEAYEQKDVALYEQLTKQWLDAILVLDEITGTNENYMLGPWIEDAKNIASTEEGKYLMEMDAKQINTTWGPRVSGAKGMFLNYANKTWNGYLKDVYYKQWKMFFENNIAALKGEEQPHPEVKTNGGEVNFDKWYEALWFPFGKGTGEFENAEYAVEPTGDTYELVEKGLEVLGYGDPLTVADLKAELIEKTADVKLTWTKAGENFIGKYEIYAGDQKVGETTESSYVLRGLSEETEYTFSVKTLNALGQVSEPASVKITTGKDETAPVILDSELKSDTEILLVFDEAVSKESAENTANYKMNGDVSITGASMQEDGKSVVLTVQGIQQPENGVKNYQLTVNHVEDISKNKNQCKNIVLSIPSRNDIVLYQPFDEIKDALVTDGIWNKNAEVVGDVQTAEGVKGNAMHFGAADQYIDFGRQEAVLGNAFTVGVWVKLDRITPGTSQTLLTHGHSGNIAGGIWWLYSNNGTLNFQLYKDNNKVTFGTKTAVLQAQKWQYVTLTRKDRELCMYVDGKLVSTGNIPENTDQNTSGIGYTFKAGTEHKTGQNSHDSMMGLNGSLDELTVFNRTLSEQEINSLMEKHISVEEEFILWEERAAEKITLSWKAADPSAVDHYEVVYYNEKMEEVQRINVKNEVSADAEAKNGSYYVQVEAVNADGESTAETNYLYIVIDKAANKSNLEFLISYAESQKEKAEYEHVVDVVKTLFEKSLAEAKTVMADEQAEQSEVDAAYEALLANVHLLGFTGNTEDLGLALEIAKTTNTEGKTEESVQILKDAIAKAEEIMTDGNVLQEDIDAARKALLDAVDGLEDIVLADKSELKTLLESAQQFVENIDIYTEATANAFLAAREAAQLVYDDPEATQEQVNAAHNTLRQAIADLREIPNKDKLKELLKEAEEIDLDKYTDETAETLRVAVANAKAVIGNKNASDKDVMRAEETLRAAIDGLKEKDNGSQNPDGDGGNTGDSGNAGDNENPGNSGNTGNNGNSGNVGSSGNTGNDGTAGSGQQGASDHAVKTGDEAAPVMAGWLMIASAFALVLANIFIKRKRNNR
ncbi:alpha-N-acetylglucosaminidase C-terminal domain-containing protein [[Ruminococcus] torques]|uniref:alpha-N-acetylglucosaminidase C-terminal domain-containing protein n=1 Tax=[Ruminococcus] torques TaxID=33039 RepID=UPI0027B8F35E|nr:alpha-N-acetylglucosaminidase TIM-barrel domain-containing protein [[Ruminococcus] torques]